MDTELEKLNDKMKEEVNLIKEKYNNLKKEIREKYKTTNKPKTSRISIPKSVKDKIWDQRFGKDAGLGKCFCCEEEINSKKFDCGHIVSVAEGGSNNIDNLNPICSTCNRSMGKTNMDTFKKEYFEKKSLKIDKCNICLKNITDCDVTSTKSFTPNHFMRSSKSYQSSTYFICPGWKKRNNHIINSSPNRETSPMGNFGY
jgi:5-methylcytosine-specific restriction protein A